MKVFKLYLKYQITLINVIIFLVIVLFLLLCYFINIYNLNVNMSYEQVLLFYYENSIYYTKIIVVFLSCFLFMKLKYERNEYLINIVISAGYTKKQNYFYMTLCVLYIMFVIVSLLFMFFILIGYIVKSYFYLKLDYFISFLNIYVLSIHYGLLTYLLIMIINNQMVFVINYILFILSELFANYNGDLKYVFISLFPNINNNDGLFYINIIYVITYIFVLYNINKCIYLSSDLKS